MSLILPDLTQKRRVRFELPPLSALADLSSLVQMRDQLDERMSGAQVGEALLNRLDVLRQRLRTMPFAEATNIIGKERLLLTLYLLDGVEKHARPFDEGMCQELLGDGNARRLLSRLRQAAQLFFAHFDRLPGQVALGQLLIDALGSEESAMHRASDVQAWRKSRGFLFAADGPERFVSQLGKGEMLSAAAERCGVPHPSRYFELAQHYHLIRAIKNLPLGDDGTIFNDVIKNRETRFGGGSLGAAALEILIRRSIAENKGRVPEKWGMRIAAIGCDPRLHRTAHEFHLWWSWANQQDLEVAKSAFTTLCLKGFLRLLRSSLGLDAERMFKRRQQFLNAIDDAGKIHDARLVLVPESLREAGRYFPEQALASFAHMRQNAGGISVICLELDDFYMIEGTHNFALRLYRKFPIQNFWDRKKMRFELSQFQTVGDARIPHQGNWEWTFKCKLGQAPFQKSWREVNL